MTIKGWVSLKNGRLRCYKNINGDYREIPFTKTRTMAKMLWADVRRATLIVEEPKKRKRTTK